MNKASYHVACQDPWHFHNKAHHESPCKLCYNQTSTPKSSLFYLHSVESILKKTFAAGKHICLIFSRFKFSSSHFKLPGICLKFLPHVYSVTSGSRMESEKMHADSLKYKVLILLSKIYFNKWLFSPEKAGSCIWIDPRSCQFIFLI